MAQKYKFGNGVWANKEGSTLAYNDENDNYKPLPFTFTRASIATRVNKEGLVEVVGHDQPRIDYTDSADGVLLLENSSTNLVTYSEDFSSGWSLDDATVSINSSISPDGTLNATLLKGNTNSSRHNLVTSGSASSTGVFSVFVKAKELKYVQIASANTVHQYVNFDVENGVIGIVGSAFSNAKIKAIGSDGWFLCSVVANNQFNGFYIGLVSGLNSSWNESWVMPNNTDGLYIWGAMLVQNSYATSYIPTSGSTVTRATEVCKDSGNSEVFNDSQGVLFANISQDNNSFNTISISDGGTSDRVTMVYQNNTIKSILVYNNTVKQLESTNYPQNLFHKVAIKYTASNVSLIINGFELLTTSKGAFADSLRTLEFAQGNGGNNFYGKTKELGYYDTALTDAELEYMTSYRNWESMVNELNLNIIYNG